MNEIGDILAAWTAAGCKGVLATVVRLEGSGYRRPGARLLILPDSSTIGAISGGCIERDVIYRAGAIAAGASAAVVRYDAVSEDERGPAASLGCGGTIDILIERADENALSFLSRVWKERRRGVLGTVIGRANFPAAIGEHIALEESGEPSGSAESWKISAAEEMRAALELGQSRHVRIFSGEGWADLLLEYIEPPLELLIFGAGADAVPVARVGKSLGWRVTVIDLRSAVAAQRAFDADRMIRSSAEKLDELSIPDRCAVVVMNHNWNHDLASLRRLAEARPRYLGVLGPRRRTRQLLAKLASPPAGDHLHYPVGLDIGAETPAEVALAIAAEITAAVRGGNGAPLRDKSAPIHAPVESGGPISASGECPVQS